MNVTLRYCFRRNYQAFRRGDNGWWCVEMLCVAKMYCGLDLGVVWACALIYGRSISNAHAVPTVVKVVELAAILAS
jgi:hypothetical protein